MDRSVHRRGVGAFINDQSPYSARLDGNDPQSVPRPAAGSFPQLKIDLVDHHSKVGPHIGSADVLITFTPMLTGKVIEQAARLKWIQTLGTGVDNLIDQPALRRDVIVTNVRGIHGPPVSEAALAAMLALARNLPAPCAPRTRGNGGAGRRSSCTTRRSAFSASA